MKKTGLFLIAISTLSTLVISCESTTKEPSKTVVKKGFNMPDELNKLAQKANPTLNYHLNSKRADYYLEQIKQPNIHPNRALTLKGFYHWELLHSGQSSACIEKMEKEIEFYNINNKPITPQSKSYLELLALAYLRFGEQSNCINNHSKNSCTLPLRHKGIHADQFGSKKALEIYQRILDYDPTDLQAKWLLNLAYMTLGEYPNGVPVKDRIDIPAWQSAPEAFQFTDIASNYGIDVNGLSGGCAFEDFNNDGHIDIIASAYGYEEQIKYFENTGQGEFIDKTETSGLLGLTGGLNLVHADYDNDGKVDLFVLRGGWLGEGGKHPNSLIRNQGNGKFKDVTKSAGLLTYHPTQTATWADFNLDGYLDIFIGNETNGKKSTHPCELYINQGNGKFKEMAKASGVDVVHFVKGVTSGDVNNDGLPDLYLSILGEKNQLFINQGDSNGVVQFAKAGSQWGVENATYSFPTWFCDVNNDGWQDLFVASYDTRSQEKVANRYVEELLGKKIQCETPKLFINTGKGSFEELSSQYGLDKAVFGMGSNFGDINNDGFPDFIIGTGTPDFKSVVPNRVFQNENGLAFKDVTYASGLGNIQKGHGVALADFDQDGDQDVYCVLGGAFEGDIYPNALYQNQLQNDNHWLIIDLEGKLSNKKAIGARVAVYGKDKEGRSHTFHQIAGTGGSFGASSLQVEMGLGQLTAIDSLIVQWPNVRHTQSKYESLSVDRKIKLKEGDSQPVYMDYEPVTMKINDHHHHAHH